MQPVANENLPVNPIVLDRSHFLIRLIQTRSIFKKIHREGCYYNNTEFGGSSELPYFSVMVITYNHEKYIAAALDSILMQERDFPIEINIIDDASTDKTPEIVRYYKSRHPEIINCYFNKKNVGHIATQINTFRGFQSVRGKYFALLEGDDYWTDKHKIKEQINFLEMNQDYIACAHNTVKIYDDGRPSEHFLPFKSFGRESANMYDLVHMSGVYHLSSIVYRNVFGSFPPYCLVDPYSCEVTINMVYGQFGDFYCIDKNMSGYRVHDQGEFSTRTPEDIWLYHIYGFGRFFLYLGPKYYLLYSSAIVKFSRYVLNATKTGEVDSLRIFTWVIFYLHIVTFAPMAAIKILPEKFNKLHGRLKKTTMQLGVRSYQSINNIVPESAKRLMIKIEQYFPKLRKLRWCWKGKE